MDRETLRKIFGQQLEAIGFTRSKSLDRRIDTFVLFGGKLYGNDNFRTEVRVDYYGYTICYYPKQHAHYVSSVRWKEGKEYNVATAISDFFKMYSL